MTLEQALSRTWRAHDKIEGKKNPAKAGFDEAVEPYFSFAALRAFASSITLAETTAGQGL